jgi:hypothetical protein
MTGPPVHPRLRNFTQQPTETALNTSGGYLGFHPAYFTRTGCQHWARRGPEDDLSDQRGIRAKEVARTM